MNSPRSKRFGKILLVLFTLACLLATVAFAEGDVEHSSKLWGTAFSLLPPVVAIILALITKEVYSSLFLGILVGCMLNTNGNVIGADGEIKAGETALIGGSVIVLSQTDGSIKDAYIQYCEEAGGKIDWSQFVE